MNLTHSMILIVWLAVLGCDERLPNRSGSDEAMIDMMSDVDARFADAIIRDMRAPSRLDSTVLSRPDTYIDPDTLDANIEDMNLLDMGDLQDQMVIGQPDDQVSDPDSDIFDSGLELDAEMPSQDMNQSLDAAPNGPDDMSWVDPDMASDFEIIDDMGGAFDDFQIDDAALPMIDAELVDPELEERPDCLSDLSYFYETVWRPTIRGRCAGCHNAEGAARDSAMVYELLRDTAETRRFNFDVFRDLSDFGWRGMPLLLAKAQGMVEHGGGEVLRLGDPAIVDIEDMIQRLDDPEQEECPDWFGGIDRPVLEGLVVAEGQLALRQVTLHLAGRSPTSAETELVDQYGDVGFELVLNRLLYSPGFYDRMRELWNDILLTDMYRSGISELSIFDYPHRSWYSSPRSWDGPLTPEMRDLGAQHTTMSIAREPIEHIIYLLKNDRPFTEIINADYIAMNPYTARFYGVDTVEFDDPWDPSEWRMGRLEGHPHAGILTSPVYLLRYPTTRTNRNRERSKVFMKIFLDYDIFEAGGNDIVPSETIHNPTMNDPQCTVCHEIMDPISGAFQNWNASGGYEPPANWHLNMRAPGFSDDVVPIHRQRDSLKWLAEQAILTPQFDRAMVHLVYTMLTGRRFENRPVIDDPLFDAKQRVYEAQRAFAQRLAQGFRTTGHDLRYVIAEVAKSPWFLAIDYQGEITPEITAQLEPVGRGRTLTPEQLTRKLLATVGHQWRSQPHKSPILLGDLGLLYGDIDSDQVVERLRDSSAIFASIQQVVANATSCEALPAEFQLLDFYPDRTRFLIPFIIGRDSLFDTEGEETPDITHAVKSNLQYLFWHLWNEEVDVEDPDLLEMYQLFVEVHAEGQRAIAEGESGENLTSQCNGRNDSLTGLSFPQSDDADPHYTIRAWQTVIFAFLVDHKFVLE